jgi:predicted ribonuclease YlaK
MQLAQIKAKTAAQGATAKGFRSGKSLVLHGVPGSGKTFMALYLALEAVMHHKKYGQIIIYRSAVPSREIGHLPGSAAEKLAVYEEPYEINCAELFNRKDAYKRLKAEGKIIFSSTSHVRGITLDDSVVILDEVQNMSYHEHKSILSRFGNNCQGILSGDYDQSDLGDGEEREGLWKTLEICRELPEDFDFVEFVPADIVRSGFVKRFITKEYELRNLTKRELVKRA